MKEISRSSFITLLIFFASSHNFPQAYKVIESNTEYIIAEFKFNNLYSVVDTIVSGKTFQKIRGENHSYRNPGEPWLPEYIVLLGIPFDSKPIFRIIDQKQSIKKKSIYYTLS